MSQRPPFLDAADRWNRKFRERADEFRERAARADLWPYALALLPVVLALIVTANVGILFLVAAPAALVLLGAGLLALFLWAWVVEFLALMNRSDGAFPGRNDKLIWAILMIVLPPVGLFLFRSYRTASWPWVGSTNAKPTPADDLG